MVRALIGDMFESNAQTLVNTVNCVGVMGKGVALEFKKRFPAMFDDYKDRCLRHEVRLGVTYLFRDDSGQMIVNFPTKDHWRSPARLSDIERGLDHLSAHLGQWGVKSMAMPPLGCGNGGLEWGQVGPLIYRKLKETSVSVEVFAPYGTPKQQLTERFLSDPSQATLSERGFEQEKLNPHWIALMEVLRELQSQPYASAVGRTVFQKICYVVTEMGVPTAFRFSRGSYGPFSADVKLALHDFANRNWIQEKKLGQMLALRVGSQYERDRSRFAQVVQEHRSKIDKTVDLFSRIKSTEQAEELMTVLYSSREIKKGRPGQEISEQDVYDYILGWKKTWNTERKRASLASAIRNLVLLGWMRLKISDTLDNSLESADCA